MIRLARRPRAWLMPDLERPFSEWTRWMLRNFSSWLLPRGDEEIRSFLSGIGSLDMFRKGDHLIVRMDVPGIPADKIDIQVSPDGVLSVKGERTWDAGEAESLCCERYYGKFERTIQLPEGADLDGIEAHYKDGVLEIRIPYRDEGEPAYHRVPVKSA
ncbi:MAG: Hsp20/alpha crystallin family protein [Armatimonadetes bacterium]|nr:Hsp20/alpha crystallin family protein [Armatimonadota bacterium]MDW8121129.1 Hsp20/alpha crystallin family protein [Armatimonadota bacterium]